MPKDNISRAISKSEMSDNKIYENLRYEGFGPFNIPLIIETLTDNKNRSASAIRTILQKNGGRLGEIGSTSHLFANVGILHIDKKELSEDEIFDIASNLGAEDCLELENVYEVISKKEDFYKIKIEFEKKLENFKYSGIEWRPHNYIVLKKEEKEKIIKILNSLEEIDDIQNVYTNINFND